MIPLPPGALDGVLMVVRCVLRGGFSPFYSMQTMRHSITFKASSGEA